MTEPYTLKPLDKLDLGKEDICEVIFTHEKSAIACRLFLDWLKNNGSKASRSEVSNFAHELNCGKVRKGFCYKRSNFYRTVLRTLMQLGFISLQERFDPGKKSGTSYVYAPIKQPLPKRPPLGGKSFWKLAWKLADMWNREFEL